MIKIFKIFIFIIVCLFSFKINYVLAVDCTRNVELGDGAGVYCYNNNGYCEAYCSAGWKESCASTETAIDVDQVQCFITDSNCENRKTCYNCITTPVTQKYYKCNTPLDGTCVFTDNAYSPSDNDSNGHQVQSGIDIWQYENTCNVNCVPAATKCYDRPDPNAFCDDGDPCTDDSCSISTGNCTHTDNGSCEEEITDTCQAVSDPCFLKIGTKCYPQYATADFINGAIKPLNCTCTQIYNTFKTGCPEDYPYLCSNNNGLICYDKNVCGSCGALYIETKCDDDASKTGWVCTADSGECGTGKWFDYCKPPCTSCLFHTYAPDYADKEGYYSYLYSTSGATCTAYCSTGEQCLNNTCCLPVPGVCGVADKQVISNSNLLNYSNLCADGSSYSIPFCTANICTWTCFGHGTGNCAASSAPTSCSVTVNAPPTFQGIEIRNSLDEMVLAENSGGYRRNHICQVTHDGLNGFDGSRQVTIKVLASDINGYNDIESIALSWKGKTIQQISSGTGFAIFGWNGDIPNEWNDNTTTYPLVATITDFAHQSVSNSSRYFKIWDCGVSVGGTIFDGTDYNETDNIPGVSCPDTGFSNINPAALNFSTLYFSGNDGNSFQMDENVNNSTYSSGDKLIWGKFYSAKFNDGISLSRSDTTVRIQKTGDSSWNCDSSIDFIDSSLADPYADNPSLKIDFTGTLIQDPWFQAQNGGVISNSKVKDRVPSTCTNNDNCKISIDGLVAAPDVSNKGKSLETGNAQTWYYSNTLAKLADYNTNYDYFYSQYFVKKAVGTVSVGKTITSASDLSSDPKGIYFINGNLDINGDVVNTGNFLMIIVKGKINVGIGVSQVDGILVANEIEASGSSDSQLIFKGSLYASNTINFSRDFNTRLDNNTKPAIVVNYDPKLIFNMPGDIAKVLTNWQWGN